MQLLVPFPAIVDNIHEEDALAEMPVRSVGTASCNYRTAVKNSAGHRPNCPFLKQEQLRSASLQSGAKRKRANNKNSPRKARLQHHFLSSNII